MKKKNKKLSMEEKLCFDARLSSESLKYLMFLKVRYNELYEKELERIRNIANSYGYIHPNIKTTTKPDEKVGYGVVGSSKLIILENNPEKGYKLNVGGRYKGEYIGRIGDIEYLCSISDHLDKISRTGEKSVENQVIEGQIFYIAKLADTNSEIYQISQRYVNLTSKFGYDKNEARKIKAECIKEIKEIYVAKIVKNYDVTRISEWNQYSRVAQRTTRNRYRG